MRFFLVIIFFTATHLHAQTWILENEVHTKPIDKVSIDNNDNLVIAHSGGEVSKYDTNGELLYEYSPVRQGELSLIEAWKTINIFTFSRDFQRSEVLNRQLNLTFEFEYTHPEIGFVEFATNSADGNIWIFDRNDLAVKKINPQTGELILNIPLDTIFPNTNLEVNYMREFRNKLYLIIPETGIVIFDAFGALSRKIDFGGKDWIGFTGDYIYYLNEVGSLEMMGLFNLKKQIIELPEGDWYKVVLVKNSGKAYLVKNEGFTVFDLNIE
ncbi:hypothetical protein [Flexithrix dorotheae]|uniref:hypothetical protein n=1 Tax=Flexithrix dorotheae TaxID=70993 RepID=UPI00036BDA81|nr:hypothetical protein [Flexithrix dorotheae]